VSAPADRRGARAALLAVACALSTLGRASPAEAIDHPRPGDPLPVERLPAAAGGARPYLEAGRVSVFVFFRPGQDHSGDALQRLAAIEQEFAGRVSFVAVVSGSAPVAAAAAAAAAAGIRMPVLVDEGDRLYGRLEVRLHPLVGVADAQGRLVAWEPFRKVNYSEVIRARIRYALGEISEAEVARAIDPPRATMPGDDPRKVARRDVKLGRMLLERGQPAKALDSARKALERDPGSAPAHALAGRALAATGDCAAARAELEEALRLDPKDEDAVAAKEAPCPPPATPGGR